MAGLKAILRPDYERYEGVRPINIYLLRLLFSLIVLFVATDSWSAILEHRGQWDHVRAAAVCMWAAFSALAMFGLINPLKWLPIVLFEIFHKIIWLFIVAYPLWSTNQLAGSPAEGMKAAFLWVLLPIVAMPWAYAVRTEFGRRRRAMIPLAGPIPPNEVGRLVPDETEAAGGSRCWNNRHGKNFWRPGCPERPCAPGTIVPPSPNRLYETQLSIRRELDPSTRSAGLIPIFERDGEAYSVSPQHEPLCPVLLRRRTPRRRRNRGPRGRLSAVSRPIFCWSSRTQGSGPPSELSLKRSSFAGQLSFVFARRGSVR